MRNDLIKALKDIVAETAWYAEAVQKTSVEARPSAWGALLRIHLYAVEALEQAKLKD